MKYENNTRTTSISQYSTGSDRSFTRDELIQSVEKGDEIGNKIAQIELEWLRSFKDT